MSVTGGARLDTSTFGQGNAASVNISATDTIFFDGVDSSGFSSGAFSLVRESAVGKSGGIKITTGSLVVTGSAQLASNTLGQGDAGNVKISASDTVFFDGVSSDGDPSGVFSSVEMPKIPFPLMEVVHSAKC